MTGLSKEFIIIQRRKGVFLQVMSTYRTRKSRGWKLRGVQHSEVDTFSGYYYQLFYTIRLILVRTERTALHLYTLPLIIFNALSAVLASPCYSVCQSMVYSLSLCDLAYQQTAICLASRRSSSPLRPDISMRGIFS